MNRNIIDEVTMLVRKYKVETVLEKEIFLKGYLAGISDQQKYGYEKLKESDVQILKTTFTERFKLKFECERKIFSEAYFSGMHSQMDNDWKPVTKTEEDILKAAVFEKDTDDTHIIVCRIDTGIMEPVVCKSRASAIKIRKHMIEGFCEANERELPDDYDSDDEVITSEGCFDADWYIYKLSSLRTGE